MRKLSWLFLLLFSCVAFAAVCDNVVTDSAAVFANQADVISAAQSLQSGVAADVRVITEPGLITGSLDQDEKILERNCASWNNDGHRKSNLIVLMLALKDRKVGIYYGDQWKHALDPNWTRIQSQYMGPRFRDKDFAGGVISGLKEVGRSIDEWQRAPLTASAPAAVVVTPPMQEPADYTELWKILKWLLALAVIGTIVGLILAAISRKKRAQQLASSAQTRAIITQQQCGDLINSLTTSLASYKIIGNQQIWEAAQALFDGASQDFALLKSSSSSNPNQEGLTAEQYGSIADAYGNVLDKLKQAQRILQGRVVPSSVHASAHHHKKTEEQAEPAEQARAASVSNNTVVAPVVINESTHSHHEHHESDDSEPVFSSGESERSGGGSSSWDFGSSSSSSDSDGGGSSSWSSSDSGGGGSSDFGGGGDSGGGSSSW